VVNDSADVVTSSGRSFHVCGPVTGKARLPTVDSLLVGRHYQAIGADSVRNFPSAAVSAATFGERPRQAADVAHLLLLAGSQRRCSLDRAGALKVCLRSVEIFDWKD